MAELDTRCRCERTGPGFPCNAEMTAEDLLCAECRAAAASGTAHGAVPGNGHFTIHGRRPGFPGEGGRGD